MLAHSLLHLAAMTAALVQWQRVMCLRLSCSPFGELRQRICELWGSSVELGLEHAVRDCCQRAHIKLPHTRSAFAKYPSNLG